jgi:excisionase family DNA binding protein
VSEDEFLTVAEIAERLKMNEQTIRNWIDRGELPAVRLGARRIRVRAGDLEKFIAESSAARVPSEESARKTFTEAVEEAIRAKGQADEAVALRRLATASTALARLLPRPPRR